MTQVHPVPVAPAPWTLQADSWIFPFWNSSSASGTLPYGSYHPMETIEEGEGGTGFKGGPGAWLLYRYSDSPVGRYSKRWHGKTREADHSSIRPPPHFIV